MEHITLETDDKLKMQDWTVATRRVCWARASRSRAARRTLATRPALQRSCARRAPRGATDRQRRRSRARWPDSGLPFLPLAPVFIHLIH